MSPWSTTCRSVPAADTVDVDEAGLGTQVQAATGFLNIAWGADEGTAEHLAFAPRSNGQLGPTLTSGGVALDYLVTRMADDGNPELVAYKDGERDPLIAVFTVTLYAIRAARTRRIILRAVPAARRARRGRRHGCDELQRQRTDSDGEACSRASPST